MSEFDTDGDPTMNHRQCAIFKMCMNPSDPCTRFCRFLKVYLELKSLFSPFTQHLMPGRKGERPNPGGVQYMYDVGQLLLFQVTLSECD